MTLSVSILGGAGYVGGELLRLLLAHPNVTVKEITSASQTGRFVYVSHPNLRGQTSLKFIHPDQLSSCDILFLAQPHGVASKSIEQFAGLAKHIIDTSADFRLNETAAYEQWYGEPHPAPAWLTKFVYGLPERNRSELANTTYISGVGCNATVTNLGLLPLAKAGVLDSVVVDVKVGKAENVGLGSKQLSVETVGYIETSQSIFGITIDCVSAGDRSPDNGFFGVDGKTDAGALSTSTLIGTTIVQSGQCFKLFEFMTGRKLKVNHRIGVGSNSFWISPLKIAA